MSTWGLYQPNRAARHIFELHLLAMPRGFAGKARSRQARTKVSIVDCIWPEFTMTVSSIAEVDLLGAYRSQIKWRSFSLPASPLLRKRPSVSGKGQRRATSAYAGSKLRERGQRDVQAPSLEPLRGAYIRKTANPSWQMSPAALKYCLEPAPFPWTK